MLPTSLISFFVQQQPNMTNRQWEWSWTIYVDAVLNWRQIISPVKLSVWCQKGLDDQSSSTETLISQNCTRQATNRCSLIIHTNQINPINTPKYIGSIYMLHTWVNLWIWSNSIWVLLYFIGTGSGVIVITLNLRWDFRSSLIFLHSPQSKMTSYPNGFNNMTRNWTTLVSQCRYLWW